MTTAYDYTAQRWVEGPEAIILRQAQAAQDVALLMGPEGEEYARFVGGNRAEMLAAAMKAMGDA